MSKQLIYKNEDGEIERYDLTDERAEEIVSFLSSKNRATHFDWNGQSFIAKNARVKEKFVKLVMPIEEKRGYDLNDPAERAIIEKFGEELANEWIDNKGKWQFKDYLIKLEATRIDPTTQEVIIRNPGLYMELNKKWNAIHELRNKEENSKKLGEELSKKP